MIHNEQLYQLGEIPLGCEVTIKRLRYHAPSVSTRLRELGIRENVVIRPLLRANGNMICAINNMRIGLDESLAEAILVVLPVESNVA